MSIQNMITDTANLKIQNNLLWDLTRKDFKKNYPEPNLGYNSFPVTSKANSNNSYSPRHKPIEKSLST